jgi:hypothetical protein
MNLLDAIKVPMGHFQLDSYDAFTGQLLDHIEGANIVVNDGREALARLLGNSGPDGGVTTWYVDTMKFGKGGHNPGDVLEMVEVLVTDSDLYDQTADHITVDQDVTGTTTWPAARKVTFEATVEAAEGNGSGVLEYSEAGLYYDSGSIMFAHKAFGYIVKNNTIKLVATWTFTF